MNLNDLEKIKNNTDKELEDLKRFSKELEEISSDKDKVKNLSEEQFLEMYNKLEDHISKIINLKSPE